MFLNNPLLDLHRKRIVRTTDGLVLSGTIVAVWGGRARLVLHCLLVSVCTLSTTFFFSSNSFAATSNGECIAGNTPDIPSGNQADLFDGNGPLEDYTTNNPTALPDVMRKDGRYHAALLNNSNNVTLHFNQFQGRLDAKRLSFPFEFIARNVGIGTLANSQIPPAPNDFPSPSAVFMFAGIQVHDLDLNKRDSAHFVVGHRGSTSYTVEGKNTVNGRSSVNDAGQGIVPQGRADLRVVGDASNRLTWYWQQPNDAPNMQADDWIPYRGNGLFPGSQADFGDEVYIGLITYAFGNSSVPFAGTADAIEWADGTP